MRTKEDILRYLFKYGKENKYRLARVFKVGTEEVIAALSALEKERKIKKNKDGRGQGKRYPKIKAEKT